MAISNLREAQKLQVQSLQVTRRLNVMKARLKEKSMAEHRKTCLGCQMRYELMKASKNPDKSGLVALMEQMQQAAAEETVHTEGPIFH